jgi:DNA-binding response OmpR family regulator
VTRILVAEDNRTLALGLRRTLEDDGFEVLAAFTGTEALQAARRARPDLVVLDIGLPGVDGYQVLDTMRREGLEMPVLVLTARSAEEDALAGFGLGADDYLTKPFRVRELLARIRALLRRAGSARSGAAAFPAETVVRFGDVEVDLARCAASRDGVPVPLRPKEYDLLVALIEQRGAVVSRAHLLRAVWGYDPMVASRTVDTHMLELRRKLEADPTSPRFLLTVRTRGYQLRR